jgi:hypothetical protein
MTLNTRPTFAAPPWPARWAAHWSTTDGSWVPLGVYTFILASITFATTFLATETRGRDLTRLEDALDDKQAGFVTVHD